MQAPRSYFKVSYNGVNITANINQYLVDVSYTDKVSGEADELEIRLEDKDLKWQNEWYPSKGASLKIEIGYDNGQIIKPDIFQLDEIELSGSVMDGDMVNLKGISTGINGKLRTKRSHAHENKSLSEIIHTIAARNGYKVLGKIESIAIGRITQHREKDLTFLHRLASEYGYSFTIKNKTMVFTSVFDLEARNASLTIDKTDCLSWNIRDKSSAVYQQANVKSYNPNTGKVVQSTYKVDQIANKDNVEFAYLREGESREVRTKTENAQQAVAKSKAALHLFNGLQQTASISLPGNVLLLAGNNIVLTGFGRNSGTWHILSSRHRIDKSGGFTSEAELKRIEPLKTGSGLSKKPKAVKPQTKPKAYATAIKKAPPIFNFNDLSKS